MQMRIYSHVQPRGLSLIEVMMAVAVLSIALAATFMVWINSERLAAISREEALAQQAINQVISEMRATPYADIPGRFSGGPYVPGDLSNYRLLPKFRNVYVGGLPPGQAGDPGNPAARGITLVSDPATAASQGGIPMAGGYWVHMPGSPEMRIIMINHENPVEKELGEVANNSDGVDLNRDGVVSEQAYSDVTDIKSDGVFKDSGAVRLFPRRLIRGPTPEDGGPPYYNAATGDTDGVSGPGGYLNINGMLVLPVVVQVRWWSQAGVPREISVVSFLVNRGG